MVQNKDLEIYLHLFDPYRNFEAHAQKVASQIGSRIEYLTPSDNIIV